MAYKQLYTNTYMILCTFIYTFTIFENVMIHKDIESAEIFDYSQIYLFNQKNVLMSAKKFWTIIFIVIS